VIARHIRAELIDAGFPLLKNEMLNRVVYPEAMLYGSTPSLIDRGGPAAREIAAIAQEIHDIFASKRQGQDEQEEAS
jgi:chromosome partitioning protein